jgi:hypothetical protein
LLIQCLYYLCLHAVLLPFSHSAFHGGGRLWHGHHSCSHWRVRGKLDAPAVFTQTHLASLLDRYRCPSGSQETFVPLVHMTKFVVCNMNFFSAAIFIIKPSLCKISSQPLQNGDEMTVPGGGGVNIDRMSKYPSYVRECGPVCLYF